LSIHLQLGFRKQYLAVIANQEWHSKYDIIFYPSNQELVIEREASQFALDMDPSGKKHRRPIS